MLENIQLGVVKTRLCRMIVLSLVCVGLVGCDNSPKVQCLGPNESATVQSITQGPVIYHRWGVTSSFWFVKLKREDNSICVIKTSDSAYAVLEPGDLIKGPL